MPATQQEVAQTLIEDFSLFDDWEERYQYIIELGNGLDGIEESCKTETNRVQGCTSNAWLVADLDSETAQITFQADSDSQIVRGLIAILLTLFSKRLAAEILSFDVTAIFTEMTLHQHLSRSRANGLNSLILKMKELAVSFPDATH